jgi:hypothetical protein
MQQIIRQFYQTSPEDTRKNYKRLHQVRRLLNSSIPGRWRLLYPAAQKLYAASFQAAHYTDITYQGQQWKLRDVPFSLSQGPMLDLQT